MPERDSGWLSGNVVDAEDARLATGVLAASGDGPVLSRTGLRPARGAGRVTPTDPRSGQVQVAPFQAVVQGTRSPTAGAYLVTLDHTKTVDVLGTQPAHSQHSRFDLIVVRQTDAQYGDATSALTVGLVAGKPAESPEEPTVVGDHMVLARISVPANAVSIDIEQILDRRVFTAAAGGVLPINNSTARPATPYAGQLAYRQELQLLEVYEGTTWKPAVANSVAMYGPSDAGWPTGGTSTNARRVFNKLTVPSVYYARRLHVTAHALYDSAGTADRYDVALQANGTTVAITVVNSTPGAGMGTAVLTALVNQPANTATTLELGIQRVDGTGSVQTGYGYPYDSINVLAIPI